MSTDRTAALTLENELVVEQALCGFEEEGVEREVALLVAFEVAVHLLELATPTQRELQLVDDLILVLQVRAVHLQHAQPTPIITIRLNNMVDGNTHLQHAHAVEHDVADALVITVQVRVALSFPESHKHR